MSDVTLNIDLNASEMSSSGFKSALEAIQDAFDDVFVDEPYERFEVVARLGMSLESDPAALATDLNDAGLALVAEIDGDGELHYHIAEHEEGHQ